MMRQMERAGFIYGAIATSIASVFYFRMALLGYPSFTSSRPVTLAVILLHGANIAIAAYGPVESPWRPAIQPTWFYRVLARSAVLLTSALIGIHASVLVFAVNTADSAFGERASSGLIGSLLLGTSVYLAAHWALRPENFLPAFVRRWADPLTTIGVRYLRRRRARELRRARAARMQR